MLTNSSASSHLNDFSSPAHPTVHGRCTPSFYLQICDASDPQRARLEKFVQEAFRRTHGATVESFMPTLLGLRDASYQLRAVAGYRTAYDHLLYLEDYLEEPIEQALAAKAGRPISRKRIVEIGNFAAADRKGAQQLMRRLPQYLIERGYPWIVFTATRAVRRLLQEIGAQPLELCRAKPERIAGARQQWGSYYDTDPRVMAGYLPAGMELEAFKPGAHY